METVQQAFSLSARSNSPVQHPLVLPGRIGLEIELEHMDVPYGRNGHWVVVEEDSLRDGVEFVMHGDGKEGIEIIESLDQLMEILNTNSFSPSWRCSTHLHVDIRHLTLPQLKRYALGSIVLEDLMYEAAGSHRKHSNFCMPFSIAEELGMILGRNWDKDNLRDFINGINMEWTKYAGMNFLPATSLGTLEFRNAEPKHTRGTLLRLINRNLAVQQYAMNFEGTDEEFINSLQDPELVKSILCMGLRRNQEVRRESLEEGAINALDIINYHKFVLKISDLPNCPMATFRSDAVGMAKSYSEEFGVGFDEDSRKFVDIEDFFKFLKYYFSSTTNWNAVLNEDSQMRFRNWWSTLSDSQKEVVINA
ncbi:hypothetical protein PQC39_gp068 [Vibrio phage Vp_R1]|uniref:Amidoligase enzyme n=1 Tax=Vibrio phage Vp_R1 TaxID=2059867 RepID=A0A2H5BQ62_9CAUD|nr:hypothetical protein PQC39_gp068 [Vibrio phage Vp_R1]AUG88432.1 hypothetical protein VPR_068 [Vibrio phage Vp_R1]